MVLFPIFAMLKVHYLLFLFFTLVLFSCNKDDVIEDSTGKKPVITLDSETGIYSVKTGRDITIKPTVENNSGAIYSWIIDSKLVSTSPELTISFDKPQEVFVIFRVETLIGTAQEELKIEVVDFAPPVISLAIPSIGLKVLPGTDYTISPDFQNVDESFTCKWIREDKIVSEGIDYTFNETELGFYTVSIEATNEDGTTVRDLEIEVVEQLPYKISFETPSYFQTTTDRSTVVGRPVFLRPILEYIDNPSFEWFVDGMLIEGENSATFKYTPEKAGDYKITVKVTSNSVSAQQETRNISRGISTLSADAIVHCFDSPGTLRPISASSLKTQSKVYEFVPAPGQFVHDDNRNYTGNENTHAAALIYAKNRLDNKAFVSLGGFGGYIIVGFDHSIKAGTNEYDFAIQGNAFGGPGATGQSNEPGIVWVMQDTNGNGLPDDEWYELRGSETGKNETIQNYSVTYYRPAGPGMNVRWTDSEGQIGQIDYLKQYHTQPYYYPAWIEADSYTLYGTRLKSNNTVDPSTGYWINNYYDWGYVDNMGTDCIGGDSFDGTGQQNGFKISNAMYPDGTSIDLKFIDFIKVQVGVNAKSGSLGEISTEVFGFTDLSM